MYLTQGSTNRIVDTLRISEREAATILEAMNSSQHDLPMAELRDSDRKACRPIKGVVVQIQHPGGSGGMFLVWPRNISRTGMGFLHGNFIYPNTAIVIHLKRPNGPTARVTGRITRCRHVGGVLHEIGVRFDQALDLAILNHYSNGEQAQNVVTSQAATRLSGRVMLIDDCVDDRELLRFMCANCGLECTEAAMLEEARRTLSVQMFDLILTDVELNDAASEEIIEGLRAARYPGPVIGLWQTANTHLDPAALEQAGFSELLTKPYESAKATALLSKYLTSADHNRRNVGQLLSEQWADEQMRPLILSYLGRLEAQVARLSALTEREPGQGVDSLLLKLCMDLQSSSGGYGYPTISDAAMELHRLAGDEQATAAQLKVQFDRLTSLVRSACVVRQRAINK